MTLSKKQKEHLQNFRKAVKSELKKEFKDQDINFEAYECLRERLAIYFDRQVKKKKDK